VALLGNEQRKETHPGGVRLLLTEYEATESCGLWHKAAGQGCMFVDGQRWQARGSTLGKKRGPTRSRLPVRVHTGAVWISHRARRSAGDAQMAGSTRGSNVANLAHPVRARRFAVAHDSACDSALAACFAGRGRGDGATDSLPARGAPKVPRCLLCMSSARATTRWHPGGQLCAHVTRWRAPTSCERTSPEPLRGASKTRRRMKFNEKPERAARAVTERWDRCSERDTRTTSSAHLP
jgi:hypothetical protein